jgi:hypothetical protein
LSKIEVNTVEPQCGTTLTLGASGDTVTLGAGASQSGFGRTGTVDWDTTAKTASFTAVSGNGYFVNTTSGAVTMTLPATPSAGDIVSVKDYAYTFATNNLTVNRNGSPIGGGTDVNTISYSTNGDFLTFIYVDGTQGWVLTNDSTNIDNTGAQYIVATGGTVTCCGDYKIHTFTGPGTFTVTSSGNPAGSDSVDYLVVAGGGSAGGDLAAGGGAGGFRESKAPTAPWTASPLATCASLPVTAQGYPITVGAGASLNSPNLYEGLRGSNSVFSTITSTGGGAGMVRTAHQSGPTAPNKGPGGSGGGASYINCANGSGNTPPVSPPQGNDGGTSPGGTDAGGGGGGGATAAGQAAAGPTAKQGNGGAGATTSISGSPTAYAGGGGGGEWTSGGGGTGGTGGGGPGGCGPGTPSPGTAGTANTGGGGGGGNANGGSTGGAGGSGIVIIRYKYQ